MKEHLSLISLLVIGVLATSGHVLVGHWITHGEHNSKIHIDFNKDNSFRVSVEDRIENEGQYRFDNDSILITDKNCGERMKGSYKLDFFTPDSARFILINDPCKDRAGEINGGIIVRQP